MSTLIVPSGPGAPRPTSPSSSRSRSASAGAARSPTSSSVSLSLVVLRAADSPQRTRRRSRWRRPTDFFKIDQFVGAVAAHRVDPVAAGASALGVYALVLARARRKAPVWVRARVRRAGPVRAARVGHGRKCRTPCRSRCCSPPRWSRRCPSCSAPWPACCQRALRHHQHRDRGPDARRCVPRGRRLVDHQERVHRPDRRSGRRRAGRVRAGALRHPLPGGPDHRRRRPQRAGHRPDQLPVLDAADRRPAEPQLPAAAARTCRSRCCLRSPSSDLSCSTTR